MYVNVIEYYRKCGDHLRPSFQISRVFYANAATTARTFDWPAMIAQSL